MSHTPQEAARVMVWYQVPSRDPELVVAVGWEPLLGSFVARVAGVPTGALLDPDRPTVAWFGSRHGELQTVQDLQDAIGEYARLGSDLRTTLEADRTGRPDSPPAGPGPLQPVRPQHAHRAQEPPSSDASIGRALLELALMVGILVVVLIFALIAVLTGAGNR
jgi:hypothetical protein